MRTRSIITLGALLAMPACQRDPTSPTDPSGVGNASVATATTAADSVILMAVGDMHADCAIRSKRVSAVAAIIARYPQALVVTMGDDAGTYGTAADFQCLDRSWAGIKSRTYAAIGNHEAAKDTTAKSYYDYWNGVGVDSGRAGRRGRGYYTLSYGGWRILVANSNQSRKVQTSWLTQQLATSPTRCTMGIWHRPLFTSSAQPVNVQVDPGILPWWNVLYPAQADVVLHGHVHSYERFAELKPDGTVNPDRGIRELVVGTGGASLYQFAATPRAGSEKRLRYWGVLKMTLWPTRYAWQFIDTAGVVRDQGQDTCH